MVFNIPVLFGNYNRGEQTAVVLFRNLIIQNHPSGAADKFRIGIGHVRAFSGKHPVGLARINADILGINLGAVLHVNGGGTENFLHVDRPVHADRFRLAAGG